MADINKNMNKVSLKQFTRIYNNTYEDVIAMRDGQRKEVMDIEYNKTKVFEGLDMTDSLIGKANNELLSRHKEIASKESQQLKDYEGK